MSFEESAASWRKYGNNVCIVYDNSYRVTTTRRPTVDRPKDIATHFSEFYGRTTLWCFMTTHWYYFDDTLNGWVPYAPWEPRTLQAIAVNQITQI